MSQLFGRARWHWALPVTLGLLCLVFLVVGLVQTQRADALTTQVSAVYQKALFESAELLDGARVNTQKVLISGDASRQQALLSDIARQTTGATDDLAVLPPGDEHLAASIKFVNQVSDYARVLEEKLAQGDPLTTADERNLSSVSQGLGDLTRMLGAALSGLEDGTLVIEPNDPALEKAGLSLPVDGENPEAPYPSLLYDGPFSDATGVDGAPLTGTPVDQATAQAALVKFLGEERVQSAQFTGQSNMLGGVYEFTLETDTGTLTGGVTQAGGRVLYLLPDTVAGETNVSLAECVDLASQFLQSRGFGDMIVSYWQSEQNLVTCNFAAVQEDVILYPDLVKVQVSMGSGLVVGVETGAYLQNHRERNLPAPSLSEETVLASLNPALGVEGIRLALIPTDGGERFCYEIAATQKDGTGYLLYVDAVSGDEVNILQIVTDSVGIVTR